MRQLKMLFVPLRYITIKHPDKYFFDLFLPLFLAGIVVFSNHIVSGGLPIASSNGVVIKLAPLIQFLSGFYVAALAAIAALGNKSIDDLMSGTPPSAMEPGVDGVYRPTPLTRRRFLCYLFGYLALLGMFLFMLGIGVEVLAPSFSGSSIFLKDLVLLIYTFLFFNMIVTTLLGLYYLSYRIHVVRPVFTNDE